MLSVGIFACGLDLFGGALGVDALPEIGVFSGPVDRVEQPGVMMLCQGELRLHEAVEGLGEPLGLVP